MKQLICVVIGMSIWIGHPICTEEKYFSENQVVRLEGVVESIKKGSYNSFIIIKDTIIKEPIDRKLYSKVKILSGQWDDLRVGDYILLTGRVKSYEEKMNPSDFDYTSYLRAEGIIATLDIESYRIVGHRTSLKSYLYNLLNDTIDRAFRNRDEGVIRSVILGDSQLLSEEVDNLYKKTGISHVLCISGFHVGLVISLLVFMGKTFNISYTLRYILVLISLGFYVYFIGSSTSVLRASLMSGIFILGRILWEEEDLWIEIALAALLILICNPYQIYQAGFLLSFSAVISIIISGEIVEKQQKFFNKGCKDLKRVILTWLMVIVGTSPILASYFYEIPFLATILNLIILPLFTYIIIASWLVIILSIAYLPLANVIADGIITLLDLIKNLCRSILVLPGATICTGSPSLLNLTIYYAFIGILVLWAMGYYYRKLYYTVSLLSVFGIGMTRFLVDPLQITYLYVGQGDGMVIQTPTGHNIVIDGGNPGKGKVIERYIKYTGSRRIDLMIVSHSDKDHIGGLIDLLEGDMNIGAVMISKTDKSDLLNDFLRYCQEKGIAIYEMREGMALDIGEVRLDCLAPVSHVSMTNANHNSLVMLLTYRDFTAMFTGDKDIESLQNLCNNVPPIDVLKVSHHGSRTGTSNEFILNLDPEYAIISCGIDNRYNHPHPEVIEVLDFYNIQTLQTDQMGAIWFKTDGRAISLFTQREEELR